ncbi:cell division protein SepF [soil metagenome]
MASTGWKKTLSFLGLVEEYEDEYAEVGAGDPLGVPAGSSEPPAAPRPEPSNVRRIPTAGGSEAPPSAPSGPGATPAPMAPSGTVNVIGGPRAEPAPAAALSGPRTADQVHITSPTAFNDVEEVGERFRGATPVLMNLQGASEGVAKRLLDFASGLIFGLDGSIERTGDRIFLLVPADVTVSSAEMQRLRDRGLVS